MVREAGCLLCSPADETPTPPCDAQPGEFDVAICVDRIETAFDLPIHRIESRWAGLRSFAPDRTPVAGFDPRAPGFFWLAGQGGYGIQTAPALAALSAALVCGEPCPRAVARSIPPPSRPPGCCRADHRQRASWKISPKVWRRPDRTRLTPCRIRTR